ncbi:hypothetical protein D3C80_1301280 [compost metagenome]
MKGYVLFGLFKRSQMHENFILYTAGCKGRKLRTFVRTVALNGFDQPDGADRDEILHVFACIVEFFDYMGNKPQVMFN